MKLGLKHAEELCAGGGDWERKNRLRVYEAVFLLATRDLARAASLLLDSIATFNSCAPPAARAPPPPRVLEPASLLHGARVWWTRVMWRMPPTCCRTPSRLQLVRAPCSWS